MYKELTLSFLAHQSLKLTIVSVKIYYLLYKLSQEESVKSSLLIFTFTPSALRLIVLTRMRAQLSRPNLLAMCEGEN